MTQPFRSAEKRLAAILAAAPDGILLCDAHGVVQLANARAGQMFGYDAQELVGQPVEMLIPQRYRKNHIGERTAYVSDPHPRPMGQGRDLVALCKDGSELPVEISLAPVVTDEGMLVVNMVRDVSERRRLQAELKRRNEALMQADQRKDEFLAVLSHELRNPLAPIRTAVEVLSGCETADPDLAWATGVIARQVAQMTRLIDDLLDVSRITRGKVRLHLAPVALDAVVAAAVETSRPLIEQRKHKLEIKLPERVQLQADSVRLAQVLANLLNNSAKYSDEGSAISLEARVQGSELVIVVGDDGMGIAPEFLPHIFETFTQADRSLDRAHGGLGIGLTLVRSLVEMHGGSVAASSAGPGCGSQFTIRLPLVNQGATAASTTDAAPARPAGGFRILMADDNVDFAESVKRLLKRRGHDVHVAHDGLVALELAEEIKPAVAIVDIGLPGMNGYDLAQSLRAVPGLEKIFIVAVSGYGRDEDRARAQDAGIDEHLTKPIQVDRLTALLSEYRDRL